MQSSQEKHQKQVSVEILKLSSWFPICKDGDNDDDDCGDDDDDDDCGCDDDDDCGDDDDDACDDKEEEGKECGSWIEIDDEIGRTTDAVLISSFELFLISRCVKNKTLISRRSFVRG